MDEVLELAKDGMEEAIDRLRKSLTKVRTGRANPAMLDGVRVDNYGSMMPLNQVSTVSVGDARLLVVKPWDRNMVGPIEKAINAQNLAQHADKLTDGTQALLKKYPQSFRVDVYKTHRTAAAPQWVYDNTLKNATGARLEGEVRYF